MNRDQGSLFDLSHPDQPPAQRHSATSVAAAESIAPTVSAIRGKVLDYIRSRGTAGACDFEIAAALGLDVSSCRARRVELTLPGYGFELVRDSNRTRTTPSGRQAAVWVAAEHKGNDRLTANTI